MRIKIKCTPNAVFVHFKNELIEIKESVLPEFASKSTIIESIDDTVIVNFNGEFALEYQYLHKWFDGNTLKEKVLIRTKEEWDKSVLGHNKRKVLIIKGLKKSSNH